MILAVVRSDVGVVKSPGKSIKFPPTLIRVQFVSAFCGRIFTTIPPWVIVLPDGNFPLGIQKMVFFSLWRPSSDSFR